MYSYYKQAYIAKLHIAIIIINCRSTASAYNQNIDKHMATCYLQIFVHQFLQNFCAMKIWHYTVDIHKHDTHTHTYTDRQTYTPVLVYEISCPFVFQVSVADVVDL